MSINTNISIFVVCFDLLIIQTSQLPLATRNRRNIWNDINTTWNKIVVDPIRDSEINTAWTGVLDPVNNAWTGSVVDPLKNSPVNELWTGVVFDPVLKPTIDGAIETVVNTPVVGHVYAVGQAMNGNDEGAADTFVKTSRSSGVLVGAALTAPVAALGNPGVVLQGAASMLSGYMASETAKAINGP